MHCDGNTSVNCKLAPISGSPTDTLVKGPIIRRVPYSEVTEIYNSNDGCPRSPSIPVWLTDGNRIQASVRSEMTLRYTYIGPYKVLLNYGFLFLSEEYHKTAISSQLFQDTVQLSSMYLWAYWPWPAFTRPNRQIYTLFKKQSLIDESWFCSIFAGELYEKIKNAKSCGGYCSATPVSNWSQWHLNVW